MIRKRSQRALPPWVAAAVVVAAAALAVGGEWSALLAKERHDYPVQILNKQYCTRCHSDAFMMNRMKLKEGSCNFLFRNGKPIRPDLAGIAPPGSALNRRRSKSNLLRYNKTKK